MRVTPLSEKEADEQSSNLWEIGDYEFQVKSAVEKESAKGNDMFALEVWIFDQDSNKKMLFDYLVNSEKAAWKIRYFAAACGLLREYEKGTLTENEMVDRTGRCTVGVQPAKDGYPAKNVIRGYIKQSGSQAAAAPAPKARALAPAGGGDIDDEIPFGPCWQ